MGGGDVMRPCVWEEGSLDGRDVDEMGMWWRWWEGVNGVTVTRWFSLRIATARSYKGVGSNSSNIGRLRVHAGVYERHLLHD
jgi:hypothetical protein